MRLSTATVMTAIVVVWVVLEASRCSAQNSDFHLDVHANSNATARDIGLPPYPGATPFKEKDSDSSSADLGMVLNSFHLSMQAVNFVTTDSPSQVLSFYRKPMAKYGQVLECNHGKPVGSLTVTSSGLTCGDHRSGERASEDNDSNAELRAGTPEHFRIVSVDNNDAGKTKFALVSLVLPKDDDTK